MTDPNHPDGMPPRPQSFQAEPHRTPGLPQATGAGGGYGGAGVSGGAWGTGGTANGGSAATCQDTPTTAIVASGKRIVETIDALGRRIKVKFITPRERMMLSKCLGPELAKNEVYLGYATLAWAVVELDNGSGEDPRIMPMVKPSEVEYLVDRLGDEGLTAVGLVYKEHFADLLRGVDVDLAKN